MEWLIIYIVKIRKESFFLHDSTFYSMELFTRDIYVFTILDCERLSLHGRSAYKFDTRFLVNLLYGAKMHILDPMNL